MVVGDAGPCNTHAHVRAYMHRHLHQNMHQTHARTYILDEEVSAVVVPPSTLVAALAEGVLVLGGVVLPHVEHPVGLQHKPQSVRARACVSTSQCMTVSVCKCCLDEPLSLSKCCFANLRILCTSPCPCVGPCISACAALISMQSSAAPQRLRRHQLDHALPSTNPTFNSPSALVSRRRIEPALWRHTDCVATLLGAG